MLLVLILGVTGVFFYYLIQSSEDDGRNYQCYVAENVSVDGDELTEKGVKKNFGLDSLSDVMTVYLKDSGDCSIILMGQGDMGTWSENNDIITVDAVEKQLKMKKNFNRLIYTAENDGKEMRFVLKKAEKLPDSLKMNPEFTYGLKYTKRDTTELSNFMLGGQYVIADGAIYGKFFDLSQGGENTVFATSALGGGDYRVLSKGGQAKYLTASNGYVYYKWVPANGDTESICRIPIEGGDPEKLREGVCDYVQVRFGKVYYTDGQNRFCSMTPEGKEQTVVIDKTVYMPYVVEKGWVIFQDDADGEKLHIAALNGLYERAITDKRSYGWIIWGRYLLYTGTTDTTDRARHMCKMYRMYIGNLEMMDEVSVISGKGKLGDTFAVNSSIVCGGDAVSVPVQKWKDLSNNLYEGKYYENSLMYLSDRYMITGQINESFAFKGLTLTDLKNDTTIDLLHREQL